MIASFGDTATKDIFDGRNTKAARSIPKELWKIAARKLSALDYAEELGDLSSPGNNLEKLKGARMGKYSIRINDQFRIVFNFDRSEAIHVVITDYHR
ncbi:MAG: type II toxin-antitoxin system RelE/ParE family toxin [Polyangiaceae bacterium]